MKIIIKGSAGFIGYHLSKKIIESGDTVIGIDQINDIIRGKPVLKQMNVTLTDGLGDKIQSSSWL